MPYDHPLEELINGLQQHKLDRACVLSSNSIFLDANAGNEATAAACRQDARLAPIGVADPRVDGLAQVEFCRRQGFRLIALFPATQGWSLSNLPAQAVLRGISDARMAVIIEASRDGEASAILHAVHDLPLPVILLDVNLYVLAEAMAVVKARPRTYLATRLLSGGDTIEYLAREVGADRLIFTSRFPVSCFSAAYLTAKFAMLNDNERAVVMGGNINALLVDDPAQRMPAAGV